MGKNITPLTEEKKKTYKNQFETFTYHDVPSCDCLDMTISELLNFPEMNESVFDDE